MCWKTEDFGNMEWNGVFGDDLTLVNTHGTTTTSIARIAQWYQYPLVTCVLPGSNPGMEYEEIFYEFI